MVSIPSAWAVFRFLKRRSILLKQKVVPLTSEYHPKKLPPSVGCHSSYKLRYRIVVLVFSFRIDWSHKSHRRGKADEAGLCHPFPNLGIRIQREVRMLGRTGPKRSCWEMWSCWWGRWLSIFWRLVEGLWTWIGRKGEDWIPLILWIAVRTCSSYVPQSLIKRPNNCWSYISILVREVLQEGYLSSINVQFIRELRTSYHIWSIKARNCRGRHSLIFFRLQYSLYQTFPLVVSLRSLPNSL